jgi:hypothetical protein
LVELISDAKALDDGTIEETSPDERSRDERAAIERNPDEASAELVPVDKVLGAVAGGEKFSKVMLPSADSIEAVAPEDIDEVEVRVERFAETVLTLSDPISD